MSRQTPLHDRHLALGAKLADFSGWQMPIEYSGTVAEHTAVRTSAGVFDVSHMGTASIVGPGAAAWLNSILTNDLDRVGSGQAQYSLLCAQDGGVIDDLIVYRLSDDELLMVPNAGNSDAVLAVLRAAAEGTEISVVDRRNDVGILAIQGPTSIDVLGVLGLPADHGYMSVVTSTWGGQQVTVCRTGYTGETGFEVIAPVAVLGDLWDAVVAAGAVPAGLGARDTLRTEMGYPLHGHELSATITPVQARLGWAVGWDKPTFHGADALRAERASGPARVLRGLRAVDRAIPRAGMRVMSPNGTEVGEITSGTFSPTLRQGIALALLDPSVSDGDRVAVDIRGRAAAFEVTKPPFVAPHTR